MDDTLIENSDIVFSLQSTWRKLNPAHTVDGPVFVPAGWDGCAVVHNGPADAGEISGVEYRQRAVDVARHCVIKLISIWVHRERPVVDQAWNHI